MSTVYRLLKSTYRRVAPRRLSAALFGGHTPLSRTVLALKARLEAGAEHDALYDAAYFARQDRQMAVSADGIAASIRARLPAVHTVVDVGCGSGAILAALGRAGVSGTGLEYAEAALARCRAKGLTVHKFDIEAEAPPALRADLALSTEVAEHLPAARADAYVDMLVGIADTVVMTAAVPGQGGTDHVNEQPNAYWIAKFQARGFAHDPSETEDWRADWSARGVDRHRARNVMVFRRAAA